LLARYALYAFYTGMEKPEAGMPVQPSDNLPTQAEAAVDLILQNAKKR